MPITFIDFALSGTTDSTTLNITLPTVEAGDVMLLEYTHRGSGTGTLGGAGGSGWTNKFSRTYNVGALSAHVYWKRCDGTESGDALTVTGLTNSCAGCVTVYRGCVTSGDPIEAGTSEENASANETHAEITTVSDGAWVILTVANSPDLNVSVQACTSPGTLPERAERLNATGTDTSISHASAEKATAGATGALTWSQTNAISASFAYALAPQPEAPPFVTTEWPIVPPPKKSLGLASLTIAVNLLQGTLAPPPPPPPIAQLDWPLPLPRPKIQVSLSTQPGEEEFPFKQTSWPLPLRQKYILQNVHWIHVPPGREPEPPFAQRDWPLPLRKGTIQVSTSTLPGEEEFPFKQTEWPVPQRKTYVLANNHWIHGTPSEAEEGVPFAQLEWPVLRLAVRPIAPLNQNLLQMTLSAAAPFFQTEWPVFKQRPNAQTWTQSLQTSTLPSIPFNQFAWITPERKRSIAGWTDSRELSLVDQQNFPQVDWPLPQRLKNVAISWTQDRKQYYLDDTIERTYDWPIPQRLKGTALSWIQQRPQYYVDEPLAGRQEFPANIARRSGAGFTAANFLLTTLGVVPVGRTEQTPPQRIVGPPQTWTQNLQQSTLFPQDRPFFQTEWSLPQRRDSRTWTWTQDRKQYYQDIKPFLQALWPSARRVLQPIVAFPQQMRVGVLAAEETPTVTYHWPNPLRKQPQTLSWTQDRKQFYVDAKLVGQSIYFVPDRKHREVGFTQSGFLVVAPFAQTSWPLPLLQKRTALTWTQSLEQQEPLRPIEWTIPPRRVNSHFSPQGNMTIDVLAASTVPIVTYDWPLPQRKGRVTDHLTLVNERKFYYEDQYPVGTQFYVLPVRREPPRPFHTPQAIGILFSAVPEVIDVIGSYQTTIELAGSFHAVIDVAGSDEKDVDVAGEWGPGL